MGEGPPCRRGLADQSKAGNGRGGDGLEGVFEYDRHQTLSKPAEPGTHPTPPEYLTAIPPDLEGTGPGRVVQYLGSTPPLHHETAKAIKADLEAIGVPYETDEGTADFHSLRAYYVSALIRSGANVAEFQRLARHAKAETTLKHYAKIAPHNLRGVVESMPDVTSPPPSPRPSA